MNIRLNTAEEKINKLKDGDRTCQDGNREKRLKKNEWNPRAVIKRACNWTSRKRRAGEARVGKMSGKIMVLKLINSPENIHPHVREVKQILYRIETNRSTLRHIVTKLLKIYEKEKNSRAARKEETQDTQGTAIGFLQTSLQKRVCWMTVE